MALPQSEILPVSTVLSFFNISLNQYFNLAQVPFPIVTPRGRVVYQDGNRYFTYDMSETNPSDTDRSSISADNVRAECYVDFATYTGASSSSAENFKHRIGRSRTDTDRLRFDDDCIRTQTSSSSSDIYLDRDTGVMIDTYNAQRNGYLFTSLDIVNNIHPMRSKIEQSDIYTGQYDSTTNSISVVEKNPTPTVTTTVSKQISTSQGNNQMSLVTTTIDKNKEALIAATKIEVGTIALDLITKQLIKALPEPVQLVVGQSPLIKIAIANLANVMISQLSIEDQRLLAVNEAMLTVAYTETIRTFKFQEIIEGALAGIPKESLALITGKTTTTDK